MVKDNTLEYTKKNGKIVFPWEVLVLTARNSQAANINLELGLRQNIAIKKKKTDKILSEDSQM